jgi:hypothetical protein
MEKKRVAGRRSLPPAMISRKALVLSLYEEGVGVGAKRAIVAKSK